MSDYTKTTDFAAKDDLTTGDPSKLILGAEWDTEFDNYQTSNNTKLNKVSAGLNTVILVQKSDGHLEAVARASGTVVAPKRTLLRTTAQQLIPHNTWTTVNWGLAIHDEGGLWNVADPGDIYIGGYPSGSSGTELLSATGSIHFESSNKIERVDSRQSNGNNDFEADYDWQPEVSYHADTRNEATKHQIVFPLWRNTAPNGLIRLQVRVQTSDSSSVNINSAQESTWFQVIRWRP